MEDNSEITLDQLTGEAQRLLNLRQDSNLISNTAHEVNAVRKNETKQQNIKGGGKEAKAKEALVRVVEEELLLFGADSMDVFGLWKQPLDAFCNIVGCVKDAAAAVIQQFPSLFSNELGRCDKMKISLQLKDDVNPVFRPKRPVAYAMQSMVEDELTRLEDNFGNADILSRLMDRHEKPEEDYVIASIQLEDDINHLVTSATQALPLNFKDLERGTQADPLLRKVFQFVQNGWPKGEEKTEDLKQFFARREALSTVGKCLLFGERVVVPANLRNRVLKLLHKGHPGVCRMKALARGYVYWPKLDSEIENAVKTCQSCASAAKSPEHCTPVDWPKTTGPWQRIHVDYAGPMEGEYYFLVVDSYSKWPEIIPTRQTTAQATVQMLRGLCARFGIPETVVSDNGTQFTSSEFRDFCMENGIHHVRTAPYHPQSNGQAERNTPNRILDQKSPGEMMLNRKVRTSLEMLRPSFRDIRPADPVVADEATRRSFSINDRVYAKRYHRNDWEWVSGVVDKRVGNVMYMVKIDGKTLRYHVNQLRMRNAETNEGRTQQPMPLNVLLDAWDMSGTTVSASSSETSAATTTNLAEREMTPADGTEASLRRSTRVRKQPAWLEGYHRS
ncbi:uncharacterized protein K02A2.6-like [Anopheles arabiensis]|uniref:uncharacterized protein K02A2.6-like n=1 Tax=Anopheles arabiensis TaxID=7173 RepID=UPI001AACAF45|nr:uncharacterized protein K02A2.6-like [Anopheles arabiensis]